MISYLNILLSQNVDSGIYNVFLFLYIKFLKNLI